MSDQLADQSLKALRVRDSNFSYLRIQPNLPKELAGKGAEAYEAFAQAFADKFFSHPAGG